MRRETITERSDKLRASDASTGPRHPRGYRQGETGKLPGARQVLVGCCPVFAPTFDFLTSHLAMNVYRGGIVKDYDCAVPLDPSFVVFLDRRLMQSFHTTLGVHT